jgi:hypothetical protein
MTIEPGTIVSVELYPNTTSPVRRYGKVVAVSDNSEWILVQWGDGGPSEYVHRKSARIEE